jgi:phage terminase small subunit
MCKLNEKQKRFVEEYLVDLNATQAAIRAGYSSKTARQIGEQNLSKLDIQEAIQKSVKERSERTQITSDWVLNQLVEVSQRCMQKTPVMIFDREEKEYVQATNEEGEGIWTFNAMGANKSLELIGKHLGMFVEKHEHTGKDGGPMEVVIRVGNRRINGDTPGD